MLTDLHPALLRAAYKSIKVCAASYGAVYPTVTNLATLLEQELHYGELVRLTDETTDQGIVCEQVQKCSGCFTRLSRLRSLLDQIEKGK